MVVAPERTMSSCVMTKIAAGASLSASLDLLTEETLTLASSSSDRSRRSSIVYAQAGAASIAAATDPAKASRTRVDCTP